MGLGPAAYSTAVPVTASCPVCSALSFAAWAASLAALRSSADCSMAFLACSFAASAASLAAAASPAAALAVSAASFAALAAASAVAFAAPMPFSATTAYEPPWITTRTRSPSVMGESARRVTGSVLPSSTTVTVSSLTAVAVP